MRTRALRTRICIAACALFVQSGICRAADLLILSTPTLKTTLEEIGPQFEQATEHHLLMKFASAAALEHEIETGEPFDVAILLPPMIDALIKDGKVSAATRVDIARSAVGMAIRAGSQKPDIASVDAFKQALLRAKSMSYASDSASSAYFLDLLDRLGIAAEVKPRLKAVPGGRVIAAVANGEAELTVITVPNIVGVPGVELAGLLPPALQRYTVFTAGTAVGSKNQEAARSLLTLLMSPDATRVLESKGMERVMH